MSTDQQWDDLVSRAQSLGRDAGTKAAAWWQQDAIGRRNTASTRDIAEHASKLLMMYDDGDPSLEDYWPTHPNLSGEWADELTPARLYAELGVSWDDDTDDMALCHAWEDAASEAMDDAVIGYLKDAIKAALYAAEGLRMSANTELEMFGHPSGTRIIPIEVPTDIRVFQPDDTNAEYFGPILESLNPKADLEEIRAELDEYGKDRDWTAEPKETVWEYVAWIISYDRMKYVDYFYAQRGDE